MRGDTYSGPKPSLARESQQTLRQQGAGGGPEGGLAKRKFVVGGAREGGGKGDRDPWGLKRGVVERALHYGVCI